VIVYKIMNKLKYKENTKYIEENVCKHKKYIQR